MRLLFALTLAAALFPITPAAVAEVHIVNQVDNTFVPSYLEIQPGDTVEWHWSAGAHTVTSGSGSSDPESGALFNATLYSVVPVFSHTFLVLGFYDYYCVPHESFGMTGTIVVEAPVSTESATWGRIKQLFHSSSAAPVRQDAAP